jgi:hypothetical protein
VIDFSVFASWSGAIVSLATTGISLYRQIHNRPEADWSLMILDSNQGPAFAIPKLSEYLTLRELSDPDWVMQLTDDGDGDAYQVKVDGNGCKIMLITATGIEDRPFVEVNRISHVHVGEDINLLVWKTGTTGVRTVNIHWVLQPTRNRHHVVKKIQIDGEILLVPKHPLPEKSGVNFQSPLVSLYQRIRKR